MTRQRSGPVEGSPAEAAVLITVLTAGPISRADIARRTGLSSAAVTRAAQPLIEAGFLRPAPASSEETGAAARNGEEGGRMGRPSLPLVVNPLHTGAIGVKLTDREAFGVVCDLAGEVRAGASLPLITTTVDATVEVVADLVGRLREVAEGIGFAVSVRHVGLSVSGDVDHESGQVRYSPFLGWHQVDLGALVADRLRCPVVVENDVKALTVAEQWFGLGRGADDFTLVTIGAGIGCAIVIGGELVRGAHSVAGEIGHLPLGDAAVPCHCGGHGCIEAEAGTEALTRRCREVVGDPALTLEQAIARARSGDRALAEVFQRAGRLVGLAIASVVNLIGSEQVIVSGEGVTSWDLVGPTIRDTFARQAFGAARRTPLHLQPLPFEEWARGAAAVALEEIAFPSRTPGSRRAVGVRHG